MEISILLMTVLGKRPRNRLISAGLEPVLSHTEKSCIELQTISTSNDGFAFHFIESCL